MKKNKKKLEKLVLIKRSRPRADISNRPTVFADKTKYKRSRDKRVPENW